MLGRRKPLPQKEVLFCSECGSTVEDYWVDSVYYPNQQTLIRRCAKHSQPNHYWELVGEIRPRASKFDPYTGEPYGG